MGEEVPGDDAGFVGGFGGGGRGGCAGGAGADDRVCGEATTGATVYRTPGATVCGGSERYDVGDAKGKPERRAGGRGGDAEAVGASGGGDGGADPQQRGSDRTDGGQPGGERGDAGGLAAVRGGGEEGLAERIAAGQDTGQPYRGACEVPGEPDRAG